jgi:N-acetylmuramoyl-L-alanine amidase
LRLAIVRGHRRSAQGARAVNGDTEWQWAGWLGSRIMAAALEAGHEARVFDRPDGPSYGENMAKLCADVDAWRPDLALELHFDAAPGGQPWSGSSAIHWPRDRASRTWAIQLAGACSRALVIRNRGSKTNEGVDGASRSWARSKRDADGTLRPAGPVLYFLRDIRAPSVILETHYGSHGPDHAAALVALESGALAAAIVDTLHP